MQPITDRGKKSFLQYLPFQKIHSNGLFVVLSENALAVTLDHTGFADSSIADHHHLDGHFHVLLQHGGKNQADFLSSTVPGVVSVM